MKSHDVQVIARQITQLRTIEDLLYRVEHGYVTPSLYNSDFPEPVTIHLSSSPWVAYGLMMHYTLQQHAAVAELRRLGISETDTDVQPRPLPKAPGLPR